MLMPGKAMDRGIAPCRQGALAPGVILIARDHQPRLVRHHADAAQVVGMEVMGLRGCVGLGDVGPHHLAAGIEVEALGDDTTCGLLVVMPTQVDAGVQVDHGLAAVGLVGPHVVVVVQEGSGG